MIVGADRPTSTCSSFRHQDGPRENRYRANSYELLCSIKDLRKSGACGAECKLFHAINASYGASYDLGRLVNVVNVIIARTRSRYGATDKLGLCCGVTLELKVDLQLVTVLGC